MDASLVVMSWYITMLLAYLNYVSLSTDIMRKLQWLNDLDVTLLPHNWITTTHTILLKSKNDFWIRDPLEGQVNLNMNEMKPLSYTMIYICFMDWVLGKLLYQTIS